MVTKVLSLASDVRRSVPQTSTRPSTCDTDGRVVSCRVVTVREYESTKYERLAGPPASMRTYWTHWTHWTCWTCWTCWTVPYHVKAPVPWTLHQDVARLSMRYTAISKPAHHVLYCTYSTYL